LKNQPCTRGPIKGSWRKGSPSDGKNKFNAGLAGGERIRKKWYDRKKLIGGRRQRRTKNDGTRGENLGNNRLPTKIWREPARRGEAGGEKQRVVWKRKHTLNLMAVKKKKPRR